MYLATSTLRCFRGGIIVSVPASTRLSRGDIVQVAQQIVSAGPFRGKQFCFPVPPERLSTTHYGNWQGCAGMMRPDGGLSSRATFFFSELIEPLCQGKWGVFGGEEAAGAGVRRGGRNGESVESDVAAIRDSILSQARRGRIGSSPRRILRYSSQLIRSSVSEIVSVPPSTHLSRPGIVEVV